MCLESFSNILCTRGSTKGKGSGKYTRGGRAWLISKDEGANHREREA